MKLRDAKGHKRLTLSRIFRSANRRLRARIFYFAASIWVLLGGSVSPGTADCLVTLTTHSNRAKRVHGTVFAICRGAVTPKQIILYVDDTEIVRQPPFFLRRLIAGGLEVRLTSNFGPHTKYWPWVASQDEFDTPLVTADDDVLYPRNWLQDLVVAYQSHQDGVVHCHRAHRIVLNKKGEIAPYNDWPPCESDDSSIMHFATGVSGVLYPPHFLAALANASTEFLEFCPKADDVWLHKIAVANGYEVKQIRPVPQSFLTVPGSQRESLLSLNVGSRENDRQVQRTYAADDLARLTTANLRY